MTRRLLALVVAPLLLVPLAACGEREELKEEVLAALQETKRDSFRFQYEDARPETFSAIEQTVNPAVKINVSGLVEDDFRFKARVDFDGQDGFDEVVSDDTLAMRFIDPGRLNPLINKEKVAEENNPTDLGGAPSLTVLQSRRWVLDPTGAPAVAAGSTSITNLGKDPVLDAVTVLSYVETAIAEAQSVERYDPEDISPAYSSSEETFPKPENGSGVVRYDLRRPKLPPPGQQIVNTQGSGRPQTNHFRRMAVYVKDGRIVQVREAIDVRGKFVKDLTKYMRTMFRESKASAQQLRGFDQVTSEVPENERGNVLLSILSTFLEATGEAPILQRNMTVAFSDLGSDIKVDLPTTDVAKGSLGFLVVTEKGKGQEEGDSRTAGAGQGSGSSEGGSGGDAPAESTPPTSSP